MSKPREFWINDRKVFHISEDGRYMQNALLTETVHVIEKSAADKLAEALDTVALYATHYFENMDAEDYVTKTCRQALKEYRGEE